MVGGNREGIGDPFLSDWFESFAWPGQEGRELGGIKEGIVGERRDDFPITRRDIHEAHEAFSGDIHAKLAWRATPQDIQGMQPIAVGQRRIDRVQRIAERHGTPD